MIADVIKMRNYDRKTKAQTLIWQEWNSHILSSKCLCPVRNFLLSYPTSSYNPITITALIKYKSIMSRYYRLLQPRHFSNFLHWLLKKIVQQNESKHCKMCKMDSKNTAFLLSILIQYYQMQFFFSKSNKNFLYICPYYKQHLNTYNHLTYYHN